MKQAGMKLLSNAKQTHFGFHKPPFISVHHLHLHCFELPFKWGSKGKYTFSLFFEPVDTLIEKLKAKTK